MDIIQWHTINASQVVGSGDRTGGKLKGISYTVSVR